MTPLEIVQQWLKAWATGDTEARARLLPANAVVHASQPGELAGDYRGFQAAAEYLRRKAELSGPTFTWEAGQPTSAGSFVILPFRLTAAGRAPWWQVAVYRMEDDHIAEVWLHEEAAAEPAG